MYHSKLHIEVNETAEEIDSSKTKTTAAAAVTATTTAATTKTAETITATATETTDARLKSLSLRGNQLCGSILIGNYSHLTYLEVTENEMEILDLSSLGQLKTLKCNNNKLMELMINGKNLTRIMASNNYLHTLTVSPVPTKLQHLDISWNNFTVLPSWVASVMSLQTLDAQRNQIQTLMEFCANYKIEQLQKLNLSYNALRTLPKHLPAGWCSLHTLHLHSNELQQLSENFFAVTWRQLRQLNVSCNRLNALPPPTLPSSSTSTSTSIIPSTSMHCNSFECWRMEMLYASSNQLDERIFDVLSSCGRLRVLHAAYNKITELTAKHVRNWCLLEELILAGNLLQRLPENLITLTCLQVLRVHSNLLLSLPTNLSKLTQLRVLDVAHNHISHVNLQHLLSKNLKYLDLSCNLQLQVDEQQLKECQGQKHWSFVDVTGRNRSSLPTGKTLEELKDNSVKLIPPWSVGFAETPGKCRRLQVAQVHSCNYQMDESCLYGMFDCGADLHNGATSITTNTLTALRKLLPKILQQQRAAKDCKGEYLKYTLMAAQQKIFDGGSRNNVNMTGICLCHIAKENSCGRNFVKSQKTKRFILRVASVGNVIAYLVRKTSNVCLTYASTTFERQQQQQQQQQHSMTLTEPAVMELPLTNEDEYLVLCNVEIWTVLDIDRVAREIRKEENVVLAAKRVQNIAQSFGADSNLSVLVVRLRNIGTDVDQMIKELKQIVRKKPNPISGIVTARVNNVQRLYERQQATTRIQQQQAQQQQQQQSIMRSERSSPSGQSDKIQMQTHAQTFGSSKGYGDGAECQHTMTDTHELELLEETDSVLSEEQFKCWEYMLEQNTQLLFDKELNTISKSFTKQQNAPSPIMNATNVAVAAAAAEQMEYKSNLLKSINNKFISTSSPHLLLQNTDEQMPYLQQQQQTQYQQHPPPSTQHHKQQLSFLSKYFGSCRSFQATPALSGGYNLTEARQRRDSLTLSQPLCNSKHASVIGGPHSAYFGSLQRLMPYNLEYDFAVTQERPIYDEEHDISADDDGDDDGDYVAHECRMRKYWGVATTEL